jgi:hypothetical protein
MLCPKVWIDVQLAIDAFLGDTQGVNIGSHHFGQAKTKQSIKRIFDE